MVMTSDETQIQIFANWPMSHAKRVTRDNPEYRVAAALRKLRTDTNCPAGKSWPNHVKNEQHMHSAQCTVIGNTKMQAWRHAMSLCGGGACVKCKLAWPKDKLNTSVRVTQQISVCRKLQCSEWISLSKKMSHFSSGSQKPARKGDGLRLYSMRFCPFAEVMVTTALWPFTFS